MAVLHGGDGDDEAATGVGVGVPPSIPVRDILENGRVNGAAAIGVR